MKCKNCRYYDKYESTCNKAEWIDKDSKLEKITFAYFADATDDSGLHAGILVGKEFGCVLFTEKKPEIMPSHLW